MRHKHRPMKSSSHKSVTLLSDSPKTSFEHNNVRHMNDVMRLAFLENNDITPETWKDIDFNSLSTASILKRNIQQQLQQQLKEQEEQAKQQLLFQQQLLQQQHELQQRHQQRNHQQHQHNHQRNNHHHHHNSNINIRASSGGSNRNGQRRHQVYQLQRHEPTALYYDNNESQQDDVMRLDYGDDQVDLSASSYRLDNSRQHNGARYDQLSDSSIFATALPTTSSASTSSSSRKVIKSSTPMAANQATLTRVSNTSTGRNRNQAHKNLINAGAALTAMPPRAQANSSSNNSVSVSLISEPQSVMNQNGEYLCDEPNCGKSFPSVRKLRHHKVVHSDDFPFHCQFKGCEKKFKRKFGIDLHSTTHFDLDPEMYCKTSNSSSSPFFGRRMQYSMCKPCGQKFKTVLEYQHHMLNHGKEPFKCPVKGCGQTFSIWKSFQKHRASHYFNYYCKMDPRCEHFTSNLQLLKLHIYCCHFQRKLPDNATLSSKDPLPAGSPKSAAGSPSSQDLTIDEEPFQDETIPDEMDDQQQQVMPTEISNQRQTRNHVRAFDPVDDEFADSKDDDVELESDGDEQQDFDESGSVANDTGGKMEHDEDEAHPEDVFNPHGHEVVLLAPNGETILRDTSGLHYMFPPQCPPDRCRAGPRRMCPGHGNYKIQVALDNPRLAGLQWVESERKEELESEEESEPEQDSNNERIADNLTKSHVPSDLGEYFCEEPDCGKSFPSLRKLRHHKVVHSDDFPFHCQFKGCEKKFKRKFGIDLHSTTHFDLDPEMYRKTSNNSSLPFFGRRMQYSMCKPCGQKFKTVLEYQQHMLDHGKEPFKCPVKGCGQTFSIWKSFQKHRASHYHNYYCQMHPRCDHFTSNLQLLKLHIYCCHFQRKLPDNATLSSKDPVVDKESSVKDAGANDSGKTIEEDEEEPASQDDETLEQNEATDKQDSFEISQKSCATPETPRRDPRLRRNPPRSSTFAHQDYASISNGSSLAKITREMASPSAKRARISTGSAVNRTPEKVSPRTPSKVLPRRSCATSVTPKKDTLPLKVLPKRSAQRMPMSLIAAADGESTEDDNMSEPGSSRNHSRNTTNSGTDINGDSDGGYRCHLCDYKFSVRFQLTKHLSTHLELSPDMYSAIADTQVIQISERRRREFFCDKCNVKFESMSDLDSHMRKHGQRPYVCSFCQVPSTFKLAKQYLSHLYEHRFNYKCTMSQDCDFTINRKDALKLHIFRMHMNQKLPDYIENFANMVDPNDWAGQ